MSSCLRLAYTKFTKIFTTPKYSQLFVRRFVNAIIQNNSGHAKYLNQRFKMPIIPTKTTAIISVVFQRLSLRWARPHKPRVDSMFQQAKKINYSDLPTEKRQSETLHTIHRCQLARINPLFGSRETINTFFIYIKGCPYTIKSN